MRLLILLLAVLLFLFALRALFLPPKQRQATKKLNEAMVPCSYCQLHLPKSEAIARDGLFFCSAEHQQQYFKNPPDSPAN